MPNKKKTARKVRTNLTLLPETISWLKEQGQGNISAAIDQLVADAKGISSQKTELQFELNRQRSRLMDVRTEVSKLEKKLDQLAKEIKNISIDTKANKL